MFYSTVCLWGGTLYISMSSKNFCMIFRLGNKWWDSFTFIFSLYIKNKSISVSTHSKTAKAFIIIPYCVSHVNSLFNPFFFLNGHIGSYELQYDGLVSTDCNMDQCMLLTKKQLKLIDETSFDIDSTIIIIIIIIKQFARNWWRP